MSVMRRVQQRRFRDAREEAFVGILLLAEQANQRLETACGGHGITHQQYNVLRVLRGAAPDGHPRYEIANRLIARAPDVTRLLDRLERMGLVTRSWSETNRRESIARITKAGLTLLQEIEPALRRVHQETLGTLEPDDLAALARICSTALADT